MEVWCCCWRSLVIVVLLIKKNVLGDPSSRYVLSQTKVTFDQAMKECTPGSLLTTTTEYEVQQILEKMNKTVPFQDSFTVWIGLKKMKSECTDASLPLRGFKWLESGRQDSKINDWLEEPKLSCTEIMCAALKGQFVQSKVKLGLFPVTCRSEYLYICKVPGRSADNRQTITRPPAVNPEPKPATPETTPATFKPKPVTPQLNLPSPGPNTKPTRSSTPVLGPDACEYPRSLDVRFLTLNSSNNSRFQVVCWSAVQLDVFCLGRPATWQALDGSPVNFTIICLKCEEGFQKNASGYCVDINECVTRKPCRDTCLNTEGSYRCVCADDTDGSSCKNTAASGDKSSLFLILIPFLLPLLTAV